MVCKMNVSQKLPGTFHNLFKPITIIHIIHTVLLNEVKQKQIL